MNIDDLSRTQITDLINRFIVYFQKKINDSNARPLLQIFADLELCIDDNDPVNLALNLPKKLKEAKKIIKDSPKMTCELKVERGNKIINEIFDIKLEADNIIERINQACTPPKSQYVAPRPLSHDSRNNSTESLNSLTTNAGDFGFSNTQQISPAFNNLKNPPTATPSYNTSEPICSLFSSCTIS